MACPYEIKKPSFKKLIEEAQRLKVKYFGLDRHKLFFELAGKSELPEYKNIGVFERPISARELRRREKASEQLPGKTVFPRSFENQILKVLERDALAFNNFDFTSPNNKIHFSFTKKIECWCGATVKFEKQFRDAGTGVLKRPEPVEEVICQCGRKWVYIK